MCDEPNKKHTQFKHLPQSYFQHHDVLFLSQDLLGKVLCTIIDGKLTTGIIVETEAYRAPEDRASHAYGGKRTKRNAMMYGQGGIAYVYLCYGVHHLFNVVTNAADVPHAILIRAIEPLDGVDTMLQRRNKDKVTYSLTAGPGSLSQALGIGLKQNGSPLKGPEIWIEDRGIAYKKKQIAAAPRIGVDYAGEDARLPWRYYVKDSPWVSRKV